MWLDQCVDHASTSCAHLRHLPPQLPTLKEAVEDIVAEYVTSLKATAPEGVNPLRVVDKMLANAWHLGNIAVMMPKACLVHVVRHPLDVALSCYAQVHAHANDLYDGLCVCLQWSNLNLTTTAV